MRAAHLDVGEGVPEHCAVEVDAKPIVHPEERTVGASVDGKREVEEGADARWHTLLCFLSKEAQAEKDPRGHKCV